jgi:SET domain-containing protein|tara:strand:+ start:24 stop:311 length:288 start_codon:yes stop_codon:yes gene_type:complete
MSYKPLPPFVTIRPSWIDGLGIFATHEIKKGTELGVSHIEIGDELHRTPFGGFINHADKSNCEKIKVNNKYYIKTTEDIYPNNELTLTYTLYQPK